MQPFSLSLRRSGRRSSTGNNDAKITPPNSGRKEPPMTMPKMPRLHIQSPQDFGKEETDGVGGSSEEKKMAEIIIKLQLAKQRADDKRKRKFHEEVQSELLNKFVAENDVAIKAMKKRRVSSLKKLSDRKAELGKEIKIEIMTIQESISHETEGKEKIIETLESVVDGLRRVLQGIESNQDSFIRVAQVDYSAAREEIDNKVEELENVIASFSDKTKDDNFSTLLAAVLKTFGK